jgi:TolB-like protein
MKKSLIFTVACFVVLGGFASCLTPAETGGAITGTTGDIAGEAGLPQQRRSRNIPLFTGDGGKGIVIAVPAPAMKNGGQADNWMPQLFQDIITGDLARYSAMTVLDRSNEAMVIAEQELSASGYYSDADYIAMGRMTNAKYIVTGNILNVSGRYTVALRINNTETNEIKTSFNKQYTAVEIEKGLAAKEAVAELLAGMGVELTPDGETELLTIQEIQIQAAAQLAKGMAAEKNDNFVEALVFFTQAADMGVMEASSRIQNFAKDISTGSIRERAGYAVKQKEKWEKIFSDLGTYMSENLEICVYDFSTVEDKIEVNRSNQTTVTLTITPGIKIIPNRTVVAVWKTVMDNWARIKEMEENKSWVNSVKNDLYLINVQDDRISRTDYYVSVGLYDEYGDRIDQHSVNVGWVAVSEVIAQHKYYEGTRFVDITFYRIPIERITDKLTPQIDTLSKQTRAGTKNIHPPTMLVSEWEQWLREQQGN